MTQVQAFFADPRVKAALHSFYITGIAVATGLYLDALANNAAGSPDALLAYAKAHWWAWAVANVITPTVRAYQAQKQVGN